VYWRSHIYLLFNIYITSNVCINVIVELRKYIVTLQWQ